MEPKAERHTPEPEPTGIGVDRSGGPLIDPTKNVLDLVRAESKYQDFAREAGEKYSEAKLEAETRRVDQLAELRQKYQDTIAGMLSKSVESTSSLVSTQLLQIQTTFNERLSKIEQWRYERTGQSSVADPALAASLAKLGDGLESMQKSFTGALGKMTENQTQALAEIAATVSDLSKKAISTSSHSSGQSQMLFWIIGGIGFILTVAEPLLTAYFLRRQ